MLAYVATTAASIVKLALPLFGTLLLSRFLLDRLDDRGLFKVQPFPWLPIAAGAALAWTQVRISGLAPALSPSGIWTEPVWAVDLTSLYERHLAPAALLAQAGATLAALAGEPWAHRPVLAILAGTTLAIAVMAGLAWRSAAAWRGLVLHVWLAAVVWLVLHHLVVLVYWTVHWLNFWIFFVLLAFVQMRRKEDDSAKVSPS